MTPETHPKLHKCYAERGISREAWQLEEITRQAAEWRAKSKGKAERPKVESKIAAVEQELF